MNNLAILYGGQLNHFADLAVFNGQSALEAAITKMQSFPDVSKCIVLLSDDKNLKPLSHNISIISKSVWTKKTLLECISKEGEGFDHTFFAWGDCPLLDPDITSAVYKRHTQYAADYSYADGWPYGLSPEILRKGSAGILAKILGENDAAVDRDCIFSVLQKDINSFDIETEISPVDLRAYRISLTADSKRNMLLLQSLIDAGLSGTENAAKVIEGNAKSLRTLPAFYSVQVSGSCPQECAMCPYPHFGKQNGTSILERRDFMEVSQFETLLDKIIAFSGDAVIDLSLWGEIALHPKKIDLVQAVLNRPALSLIIETAGIGWNEHDLETIASLAAKAETRINGQAPISWIISLDSDNPARYQEIRGAGFAEARQTAERLYQLFPKDTYVQAVRIKSYEDDLEQFYRKWKERGINIIVQKYDDFCESRESLQASDLSPIKRHPCWHLMRDVSILIDGTVPLCKEVCTGEGSPLLGNVFTNSLESIWDKGAEIYLAHTEGKYPKTCAVCDEYYTYNF
ncbi:MAG: spiro-SPASM protein [Treponema sp.]|jgi:spiro-SPASM protein|nr:spiro-SPASM protein [Treponema sp.]